MSHFNESLYLKKEIQRLHEENMKLKKYLYEMEMQQDAGSLMVPQLSAAPDTYLPALRQDTTNMMQDPTPQNPPSPSEEDLKLLRTLSVAQMIQKLREMIDKGNRGIAQIWVEWLRQNRRAVYDLLDKDLRDLAPDPVVP
jgi:uncharacterized protein YdeI (YjbR/CyaY-like superfamily)